MPTTKRQLSKVTKPKQTKQVDTLKPPTKQPAGPSRTKGKWYFIVLGVISLAAVCSSLYFYNQNRRNAQLLKEQSSAVSTEESSIIENISKHLIVPEGEKPTIATVTDKTKLDNQPFFDRAKQGDKVVVYPSNRKVILYRPSVDKIVEMSVLANDEPAAADSASPAETSPSTPTP